MSGAVIDQGIRGTRDCPNLSFFNKKKKKKERKKHSRHLADFQRKRAKSRQRNVQQACEQSLIFLLFFIHFSFRSLRVALWKKRTSARGLAQA